MITPAFLILAAANLVASTLSRLARVVDQARETMELKRKYAQTGDMKALRFEEARLRGYAKRTALVQGALACWYTAIGLFVASSVVIAIDVASRHASSYVPVWLTISGAVLLFAGSIQLLAETTMATIMIREEIAAALK